MWGEIKCHREMTSVCLSWRVSVSPQVLVLELETRLQKERERLGELRKKHYELAGVAEGWGEEEEGKDRGQPQYDYTNIICKMTKISLLLHRHRLRSALLSSTSSTRRPASVCLFLFIHTLFFPPLFSSLFFSLFLSQIKRCFFSNPASPPVSESFHKGQHQGLSEGRNKWM